MTDDRLTFKFDEFNQYVEAAIRVVDEFNGEYFCVVGNFIVGSTEFHLAKDIAFLTKQDMLDIITQMEKYNGN